MANKPNIVGGHASAIIFSNLQGSADQSPTLTGTVTYVPTQEIMMLVEDVQSPEPVFRTEHRSGHIRMSFVQKDALEWLEGRVIHNAGLFVRWASGVILTATSVTMAGDPVEKDMTAGTTSEVSFYFASATST